MNLDQENIKRYKLIEIRKVAAKFFEQRIG